MLKMFNCDVLSPNYFRIQHISITRELKGGFPTNLKKLFLEQNVGGFDLVLRTFLGVLAIIGLAMGFVKASPLKWIAAVIAFTGLYSSILRHCTPYSILGISTAEEDKNNLLEFYSHQQYIRRK